MNLETLKALDHALLAMAGYNSALTIGDTGQALKSKLMSQEPDDWPSAMADYFSNRYKVVAVNSTNISGYNGVLFKGVALDNSNNYIMVNGGSNPHFFDEFGQFFLDWTANAELAITGINHQILAMDDFFHTAEEIAGNNSLTITGHSLGGYLSLVLYTQYNKPTYTFNGAGLANTWLIPSLFNQLLLAASYEPITLNPSADVKNYYAAEGLSASAALGIYLGQRIAIQTDSFSSHSITNIIDTLAVYNLLGMVDSDITISELNGIKEASSKISTTDNDALVKAFGSLLNKAFTWGFDTLLNDVSTDNNKMHEAIYAMVQQLQTTPQALQITPLVSFNESGQLQLHTNQDINSLAYRYALKELNPFIVEGINYSSFNQSGQLDDYNEGGAANDTSYRLAA